MKSLFRLIVLGMMTAVLAGCMTTPETKQINVNQIGYIQNTATGKKISPEQLAHDLQQASIVMIGEQHNIFLHHQLENWLLQFHVNNPQASTVFEMLNNSQQAQIDTVHQWLLNGGYATDESLASKIDWDESWNWSQYQAVMNTVLRHPAKIITGLPVHEEIYQHQQFIPPGKQASNPKVGKYLTELMGGPHKGMNNLVAMQQYKDYSLAQKLVAAPHPAWLLAGAVHTSKLLGIPLFLHDMNYKGSVKVLIFTDEGSGLDPANADYIWFVPPQQDQ